MTKLLAIAMLAILIVLLDGCVQASSPVERQEQQEPVSEERETTSAPQQTAALEVKEVGETAQLSALPITLNGVRAYSFEDYTSGGKKYEGHYYAVVDVTIENQAQAPADAFEVDFQLRDKLGYTFETEPLSEQKPPPEGPIPPGGKLSGEIAFDLGTEDKRGPFTLFVSLLAQPDVPPAMFEFELE